MHIDLSRFLRAEDGVLWGQASAEPQTLVEAFVTQRAAFSGVSVFLGINYTGIVQSSHADHLRLAAYCGAGYNRRLHDGGVLDVHPHPYSRFGDLIRDRRIPCDVVLLQVSPPNAQGDYSLGMAVEYLPAAIETARAVVAEVNDQVPWTHGERSLRREDFTALIETSRPPAAGPTPRVGSIEQRIARHAAAFVPDGATIELGLGVLPDAVLGELTGHKDLGVHSGTLSDGIVPLIERGVISNACKPFDQGKTVGGVLLGTERLYRFAHRNPAIELRSVEHTHAGPVLFQLPRFVAINSAVEVDLTGQVNAEIGAGSYVGAVGGALDFIRAANASRGGVSLVCLPATAGSGGSRIVTRLSGPVATPRGEAGVFVTEFGAADLRGLPLRARVPRMIAVAHPDHREQLEREAHTLQLR